MPRTVPVIATEIPGTFITSAMWNAQVAALGSFSLSVPRFRGYQTTAQSAAATTWTSILIDSEEFDSEGGHSTTANTSRYVCQVAGTYFLSGAIGWAADATATGQRSMRLAVNGLPIRGSFTRQAPTVVAIGMVTVAYATMAVGDYAEVQGYQNSGAALVTNNASGNDLACALGAHWIGS